MQHSLPSEDIIKYLKNNIEPLEDSFYGQGYRASVYLRDGTYLPCVIFRNSSKIVNLAIKRFKEEKQGNGIFSKSSGMGYYNIVKTFVAKGNCINEYDIAKINKSPYAFPIPILKQIQGETAMSWTCFVSKMKDGMNVGFGTTFYTEFFDIPDGYSVDDIVEIINHSYISESGQVYKWHEHSPLSSPSNFDKIFFYRERPFFECYLDNL